MQNAFLDKIIQIVSNLGNLAIKLGLAVSVVALIYAGYKYFSNPDEVKKTHLALFFIIAGILIILLVFDIPKLLREILQ